MEIKDSMEKLTKPGLWFVKSMQPAMDISRMVYEVAVKGCLALVVRSSCLYQVITPALLQISLRVTYYKFCSGLETKRKIRKKEPIKENFCIFATEMNETKKGFVQLHLSVLLAGFTGLFGRLITLNEVDIVWYRMLFTSCILFVFTGLPRVGWRKFLQLCGCGALLGLHWMLFYGSIKASNVSIGVICFSLIGFFTAIFEPLIFKKRLSGWELLFSLITVAGVLCIFSLDARYRYGIMIGVVSSAVCALYAICNKKASVGVRSRTVLMYQMSGGLVLVSAMIPFYLMVFPSQQPVVVIPDGSNLWFMLCHALFCTVGMYLLQIQALKRLSAFTVNLTYNLEPCYTIILAFLIFGEGREINFSFYLGIALILLSVFLQSMKAWRRG